MHLSDLSASVDYDLSLSLAAVGVPAVMRVEMIEDEFDKYFARAALGRGVDEESEAESRRGSLPSATLKIVEPSGCRRTHSCKYPATRRRRSVSPRPRSPQQRPTSLLIDSNGDGEGNNGSSRNLLSDNYVYETTLRAPSPGTGIKCHSAPHSRSSSWKKSKRPRGGPGQDHLDPRPRTGSVPLEETISKLEQLKLLQSDDVCPVRSFAFSSKGLINRGDSFKRKSNQSVASEAGSTGTGGTGSTGGTTGGAGGPGGPEPGEGANRSRAVSVNSQCSSKASSTGVHIFKVLIVGDHGVGKTALLQQFMTSEYMGATDTSFGESTYSLSIFTGLLMHTCISVHYRFRVRGGGSRPIWSRKW